MLEQYAETAYRGKQETKFRNEIATDERDSMYCRYQSKQALFPRGSVFGHCYNNDQKSEYKYNLSGKSEEYRSILCRKKHGVELALSSNATNYIDVLVFSWVILHITLLFLIVSFPFVSFVLGDYKNAFDYVLYIFIAWAISKLFNVFVWPVFRHKIKLAVVFNRLTGGVSVPDYSSRKLDTLPFKEFNAHYKVSHNPKSGFPYRGFTLLHFTRSARYEVTYNNDISCGFIHWELLQNFMDITQPLADIPQFEYYREFDKTTAEFDKANGRPKYFWYRVDKSFLKQMNQADDELLKDFNDEEQLDNLLMGKPIKKLTPPDIFKFPWKYADNIKAECDIKFSKTLWQKFTSFLMVDL
ncbi:MULTISPECIES: hypothetical protein [unclassified Pseudoalteromonas]|uniref:hypothetical protein n=1 Tax=unclassified Pseudoalteromonas TaxID=194690 RepID=UPI001603B62B|nr:MULTISPECIES: hypothetical protein [unclassified Pseudoalteromonas]MBB1308038.1 hypothetical protein [Pseudoalteromonas sp. SR41-8]MBB1407857.1 hypothetical protein [Pseudoalteromonas sp. SG44-17]